MILSWYLSFIPMFLQSDLKCFIGLSIPLYVYYDVNSFYLFVDSLKNNESFFVNCFTLNKSQTPHAVCLYFLDKFEFLTNSCYREKVE